MSKTFTDEELDGLTAEEREALLEGDAESDDGAGQNEEGQGEGGDGNNEAGEGEGETQTNAEAEADAAAAAAAAAASAADPAASAAESASNAEQAEQAPAAPRSAPVFTAQAPEGAEAKLKEIADKRADLRKKYDDGDVTFDEYEAARDQLAEQADDIKFAMRKADLAAEMEQQRQANEWQATCDAFLYAHAEYADAALFEELNDAVKTIAVLKSSAGLTGAQVIEKAHRFVQAERGTPVTDPAPAAATPPKAKKPAPELPPTLAKMPASDVSDTSTNRFAAIDRLQGEELEEAIAKLSSAEREAYRAGA